MANVRILNKTEIPSPDPARIGKKDAYITYEVDPLHVYYVTIPDELLGGPDEDQLIAETIKKDLAGRERFIGKTIEI